MAEEDILSAPEPEMDERGSRFVSLVWLIPLIAVAVALVLLWRDYAGRGPVIEIAFSTAAGLDEGQTALRYRNVDVGLLEELRFSPDLSEVVARVRIDPEIAPYIDDAARFWVVRPEVSTRGVSGLETVISGAYIEGYWDASPGEPENEFTALEEPPLTPSDTPGKRVRIVSADGGSISVGAPVFFRRVEVGRVESKRLTADGDRVEFDVFVNAPNDARLTEGTRFWIVSGVDVSLGADGARFRIGSLTALLQGGVAFQDFSLGPSKPVADNHVYTLYDTPGDARAQIRDPDPGELLLLDVYFGRSVRGLSVGAPVEYEGIRVGQVTDIAAEIDPETSRFSTRTTIGLSPSLLGLRDSDVAAAQDFIERAVGLGLRAQLSQGSLLTGALIVRLVDAPEAAPDTLQIVAGSRPRMPSIPSDLDEIAGSVQGALRRVEQLPIEAIFDNAVLLLENVNVLLGSAAVREAPGKAVAAMEAATALLASPGMVAAPEEISRLLASVNEMAASEDFAAMRGDLAATLANLRALTASLDETGLSAEAAGALAALRARLEDPALAGLVDNLNQTSAAATAFLTDPELLAAPGRAVAAIDALEAILASPGLKSMPEDAGALLASLRGLVDAPETLAARDDLAALLASARGVAAKLEAEDAAGELAAAIEALRARLADPALDRLVGSAADAMASASVLLSDQGLAETPEALNAALASLNALLDDPATRAAPAELTASLASARALLEELQRQGAAAELAASLKSARALLDDPALRALSAEVTETAAALRAVLEAPGAKDLPASATAALASSAALLDRIREEDLAGTAAAALASVDRATAAIAGAADGAPELVRRLNGLAARADDLLASIDVGSELNYEAVAAIREIRDAARAVSDLADLVERDPNVLILGK
ncbi:MAG: MlaD family protein [Pikeienuella sp.]